MPLDNLAKNHFTATEKQQLDGAITTILNIVEAHTYNLTPKERSRYGKIGDQKRLFIDKVRDIQKTQTNLCSPDINWNEFEADYQTRQYAANKLNQLESVATLLLNIKILHDYDNFNDALLDYRYCGYKNRFGNQNGFEQKIISLKGFFPKTGKRKKKES
ncbi:hypothetical protein [Flavobacterium sp.]|uniref:hypothetical protein n=1 Tax=Flavobacterium sp. TaxID=239 RepID=UPI0025E67FDB|nr:hypothetical protein [Flavobacterium sp.]